MENQPLTPLPTPRQTIRTKQQLEKDYSDLITSYDENISSFFESLDTACCDLVMENKIPLLYDNQMEKVFDETAEDLKYKQLVKQTFVTAVHDVQCGQDSVKRALGNLPKQAVEVMKDWCDRHHEAPYPTEGEKQAMSKELSLSVAQISQWFSNYRKRIWRPSLKGCSQ